MNYKKSFFWIPNIMNNNLIANITPDNTLNTPHQAFLGIATSEYPQNSNLHLRITSTSSLMIVAKTYITRPHV